MTTCTISCALKMKLSTISMRVMILTHRHLTTYLMQFVQTFTQANQGKAFYTGLKGLGEMIFEDYETNRKKRIRR